MSKINHLYNSKEGDVSQFLLNSFRCVDNENKSKDSID